MVPSLVSDSFAGTDNKGRDQGKKTSNGCDKGKEQKNNPNCDQPLECDEGFHLEDDVCVPDVEPFTSCDTNGDGVIDLAEAAAATENGVDANTMADIEFFAGSPEPNDVIDTEAELSILNAAFGNPCP